MNWRDILGNLLMKAGDSLPMPTEQVFVDPFNYTLASLLQGSQRTPVDLLAAVQKAFPNVMPVDYAAIRQQIEVAQNLAADLASEVNKQHLSQRAASERLQQAFPQIEQANLGSLLLQNLLGK